MPSSMFTLFRCLGPDGCSAYEASAASRRVLIVPGEKAAARVIELVAIMI